MRTLAGIWASLFMLGLGLCEATEYYGETYWNCTVPQILTNPTLGNLSQPGYRDNLVDMQGSLGDVWDKDRGEMFADYYGVSCNLVQDPDYVPQDHSSVFIYIADPSVGVYSNVMLRINELDLTPDICSTGFLEGDLEHQFNDGDVGPEDDPAIDDGAYNVPRNGVLDYVRGTNGPIWRRAYRGADTTDVVSVTFDAWVYAPLYPDDLLFYQGTNASVEGPDWVLKTISVPVYQASELLGWFCGVSGDARMYMEPTGDPMPAPHPWPMNPNRPFSGHVHVLNNQWDSGLTPHLTVTNIGWSSPGYSFSFVESGKIVTASVPLLDYDYSDLRRYQCLGWTGTGSVPDVGWSNSFTFTMLTNSTLTWYWTNVAAAVPYPETYWNCYIPDILTNPVLGYMCQPGYRDDLRSLGSMLPADAWDGQRGEMLADYSNIGTNNPVDYDKLVWIYISDPTPGVYSNHLMQIDEMDLSPDVLSTNFLEGDLDHFFKNGGDPDPSLDPALLNIPRNGFLDCLQTSDGSKWHRAYRGSDTTDVVSVTFNAWVYEPWYPTNLLFYTGTNAMLDNIIVGRPDWQLKQIVVPVYQTGELLGCFLGTSGNVRVYGETPITNHVHIANDQWDYAYPQSFLIQGMPAEHGTPLPYGYGSNSLPSRFVVRCEAASLVDETNGVRYACSGWIGSGSVEGTGTGNVVWLMITNQTTLTWLWSITEYWLDAGVSGNGGIDVGNGWYTNGAAVSLTATASNHHHFVGWTGDVVTNANPLVLTMTRPYSVTANFAINTYGITASAGAGGTVTPSGAVLVTHGGSTSVTVQADAEYHIAEVVVDNEPLDIFGPGSNAYQYVFSNVTTNHTLNARFNHAPSIGVSASVTSGAVPLRVAFDFGASTDPENNIVQCLVDKDGDGNFESGVNGLGNLVVTYPGVGLYSTTLKVVDAYALTSSTTIVVEVWGTVPTAEIAASPTNGSAPLNVTFYATNSSPAPGRQIVVYEWDFNADGAIDRISTTNIVAWTYGQAGTNTAILKVTDDKGLQDQTSIPIVVTAPVQIPPDVTLAATPNSGKLPLDVAFTATLTQGSAAAYRWDFDGDGQYDLVTALDTTTYRYTVPGNYAVSVTAVDSNGLSDAAFTTVQVTQPIDLKVWITQPKDGESVWGSGVTVMAHAAPGSQTAAVQLQYKPAISNDWLNLGAAFTPQPNAYKGTWNVTNFSDGSIYQLRALGWDVEGGTATSEVVNVTVDSGTGGNVGDTVEGESDGKHVKNQTVSKDDTTQVTVYDGTAVTIPAGAIPSNATVSVELTGTNVNPVNGSAWGLAPAGENRKISIFGEPDLSQPLVILIPYPDADDDGIVDGLGIPEKTLTAHWYDPVSGQWKQALSSEVNTKENYVKVKTYHLTEFGVFGNRNLLHPDNGGMLLSFTSEASNTTAAANLTDGNTVSHWQSALNPTGNQVFVYGFTNYQGAVLTEAAFYNHGGVELGLTNYSRQFSVLVSMDGTNYALATNGVLAMNESPQVFDLNTVTCRWVALVISGGASTQAWNLAEFELHGSLTKDPDADGMDDAWEMQYFGNFDRGGNGDYDQEGLIDLKEYQFGSNPLLADTDKDGLSDYQEWVAGTSPTNAADVFAIRTMEKLDSENMVIWWDSVTGRLYNIYSRTSLVGDAWITNELGRVGTGGSMGYTNTDVAPMKFFRIGVEKQE